MMTIGAANMSLTMWEARTEVLLILHVSHEHPVMPPQWCCNVSFDLCSLCVSGGRLILPSITVLNDYITQQKDSTPPRRYLIIVSSFMSDVC